MPDPPAAAAEPCPACGVLMEVSHLEPWSDAICPSCARTVKVRTRFHHFLITREVGQGGMSRVFGARDESLGRDLALKILHPLLSQDEKRLRQFEREAQITASISHPNVVKVYTAGRDQGSFYIAMELVEGGSLDDLMTRKGKLNEAWVLEIAEKIAHGLHAAADAGLIHRDIKPGNILLASENTPKIVDFGLAIFSREGPDSAEIWATPYYVPPETLAGEPEDFRSDIYALGSSLYHALMGKPLFNSDSNSLAQLKALKSKPPDLREAASSLSAETVAVLKRTLQRKPSDRYNSYSEFIDHLGYARRRLRRGGRGAPWPGRQGMPPRQWAAVALLLLLGGAALWHWNRDPANPGDPAMASPFLTGSDPALGTDSTISSRFLEAREALFRGEYADARTRFNALAGDPATRQPTAGWARYNAGLAALFNSDFTAARGDFAALRGAGAGSGGPADQEIAQFFALSASTLDSDGAVPADHLGECPPDSVRAIGLLAAGLKNWCLGDLPGAAAFLRAFAASTPPRPAAWVDRYKELVQAYLDDVKTIEALPSLPLAAETPEAAAPLLERARKLAAGLTLPGAGRDVATRRLTELAAAITALEVRRQETAARELESKAALELEELSRIEAEVEPLGLQFSFSEAAARLRRFKPATPRAREVLADRMRWWENADTFLATLKNDLSTPLEGSLEPVAAGPLRGVIAGSTTGLRITAANGAETNLPLSSFSAASLSVVAERVLDRTPDSDAFYRRRELLVSFALRSGLKTYAVVAGRQLARENPYFRVRWYRTDAIP